ncbi:hypothetical protein D3C76_231920 [compost metagenome]
MLAMCIETGSGPLSAPAEETSLKSSSFGVTTDSSASAPAIFKVKNAAMARPMACARGFLRMRSSRSGDCLDNFIGASSWVFAGNQSIGDIQ